jgi:hypothetical protein
MSAMADSASTPSAKAMADGYSMDLGEISDRSRDQRVIASDVRNILAGEPQTF